MNPPSSSQSPKLRERTLRWKRQRRDCGEESSLLRRWRVSRRPCCAPACRRIAPSLSPPRIEMPSSCFPTSALQLLPRPHHLAWDAAIAPASSMARAACAVGLGDFPRPARCGTDAPVSELLVKIAIELNVILGFGGFWEILNCLVNWNVNSQESQAPQLNFY